MLNSTAVSAAEPRRVLLLNSFGHPYSHWSDVQAAGFRAELFEKSSEPIDLYELSLDTETVQSPKEEASVLEYIRTLLSGRKLDLLVPLGTPAAYFVQRHRSELFATTPVMVFGADVRRVPLATLGTNDTAILYQEDRAAYIENILRLLPDTREIGVVVGNSPVERFWTTELLRDSQPLAERVHITLFNDLTFGEMLRRAATMPLHSAILWYSFPEEAGSGTAPLTRMREVAAVPIFGGDDYELGHGIVGGPLTQYHLMGQEAGDVAVRILEGEAPGAIKPVMVSFGSPAYDWRELQRWRISEAVLPRGSVIQYREPSVWQRYRLPIALAVTLSLLQTALILGLLYERHRRRYAESESRERVTQLALMNRRAAVSELSASIAHELKQPVGVILRYIDIAKMILNDPSPDLNEVKEVVDGIGRANQRSGDVIDRLRRLLSKAPLELREIDLNQLIGEVFDLLIPQASVRGVTLRLDLATPAPRINGDAIQLQQVILNLVINALDALTAANSPEGTITARTVFVDDAAVEVLVEDSGPGMPTDVLNQIFDPFFSTKETGMGMGLSIARTIVEAHGGRIRAENVRGHGALFRVSLPLAKRGEKTIRASEEACDPAEPPSAGPDITV